MAGQLGLSAANLGAVFVGGAVGSLLRYGLTSLTSPTFPWDVLVINVVGSFMLAGITARCEGAQRLLLGTGLCGGFTTYSLLSVGLAQLAFEGRWAAAAGYFIATLILGVGAAWLGWATFRKSAA